jgi:hypothetical protein
MAGDDRDPKKADSELKEATEVSDDRLEDVAGGIVFPADEGPARTGFAGQPGAS